ncbi:4-hydroxybenzoate polyprenyl transferase [Tremella mesenterica]|uniref:4-hydroxybenzoate polyprenyltransferase, mitochondrial n=1 Tax=Tremella mesenterica TaxID=5217 RepID=A0A4V1M4S2_TREME|nr:4-hydroxybenzoate polyprenyl transferase [Tremella mesenterica]
MFSTILLIRTTSPTTFLLSRSIHPGPLHRSFTTTSIRNTFTSPLRYPLKPTSTIHRSALVPTPPTRSPAISPTSPKHEQSHISQTPSLVAQTIPPASAVTNPPKSIIDRFVPEWAAGVRPYLHLMRLDKPIGWILLYWPCAWSITIASTVYHLPPSTPIFYCGLFALGAFIMRGAGCTINDMWDRKFDAAVERTKSRPLAKGDITPLGATTFLGGQLTAGLGVLTQLNWYSIVLGASSLGLVFIYPFMKRITYYPHVVLGLAFSWGSFLGWSAVTGSVDWAMTTPMFLGSAAWCVMYDTIYAHQDKKDDILVGVKSIALRFPSLTQSRILISSLSTFFLSTLIVTGQLTGLGPAYYLISCGGAAGHLAWQCATVNFDSREDLWKKFSSNGWLGLLIWMGMVVDYVQQVLLGEEPSEDMQAV